MAADVVSASTEFDVFATRPVQTSTLETLETSYKPIAALDQSDLEFFVPADQDTYINLNMQLYIRGKLMKADGTALELTDTTCVTNNPLHTLFEQCNVSLNGVTITHSADLYHYRAYLETLLTYGNEAAESHFTNAFWYRDKGDMGVCDPSKTEILPATNSGYLARCDRIKRGSEVEMVGRLHTDMWRRDALPTGRQDADQIDEGKTEIYVHSATEDTTAVFKILDAQLLVKRVRPNPDYLTAHNTALQAVAIARYNMISFELKTFTFAKGLHSLSIDNAVLGPIPKGFYSCCSTIRVFSAP